MSQLKELSVNVTIRPYRHIKQTWNKDIANPSPFVNEMCCDEVTAVKRERDYKSTAMFFETL